MGPAALIQLVVLHTRMYVAGAAGGYDGWAAAEALLCGVDM